MNRQSLVLRPTLAVILLCFGCKSAGDHACGDWDYSSRFRNYSSWNWHDSTWDWYYTAWDRNWLESEHPGG